MADSASNGGGGDNNAVKYALTMSFLMASIIILSDKVMWQGLEGFYYSTGLVALLPPTWMPLIIVGVAALAVAAIVKNFG